MKKVLLCIIFLLVTTGCKVRTMDDVIQNESSISGIVKEINDNCILIENSDGRYCVSKDAELSDSYSDYELFDELTVYYDGNIAESDPMQINKVYAILLKNKANIQKAVMAFGYLYYSTGEISEGNGVSEDNTRTIMTSVDYNELPQKDDESNFGSGYKYVFGEPYTILVEINNKWCVFAREEDEPIYEETVADEPVIDENEIVSKSLARYSDGSSIVMEYYKKDEPTYNDNDIYLINKDGDKTLLTVVNDWEGADIGFFLNGDVYVYTMSKFDIYKDGVLDYSLGEHFDLVNNLIYAVQRREDGFYIVYCRESNLSTGVGETDERYMLAKIDWNGNIEKEADTGVYQQVHKSHYLSVKMLVRNGVIRLEIGMYDGSYTVVNFDENSFEIID